MAFVGGIGGGHVNAHYTERRASVAVQKNLESFGCINFPLKKSKKKKDRTRLLKERMRQFSIWFFENEDNKEIEHARRRLERKKKKRMMSRGIIYRFLICLYGFDVILWIIGILFTLCSSIKTFGKNTTFYKQRHIYHLLGPCVLLLAVIVLFLATGLKHRIRTKKGKPQRNFYIVQKEKKVSTADIHKDPNNDSGNEEDIEMHDMKEKTHQNLESEIEKENLALAKSIIRSDKGWSNEYSLECTKLVQQPEVGLNLDSSKRDKGRKAWAKTKWMRVDTESDDDVNFDDIVDFKPSKDNKLELNKTETVDIAEASGLHKPSEKRRLTRFKPNTTSCFSAQSSIRSQMSEVSFASTTSESAPLCRK